MADLRIGDKAPDFALMGDDAKEHSLAQLKGKRVVLFFYPKDDTPGCTKEACEFTERLEDFVRMDATVLGVSTDSTESHRKFAAKSKLSIELLSDPRHETISAYGAWQPKKIFGKEILGTVRSTFLIDPTGKIAYIWPTVKPWGHANEVRKKLAELTGQKQEPVRKSAETLPPPSL